MPVAFYAGPFKETVREVQISDYLESKGFSSDDFFVAMIRIPGKPPGAKIMFTTDMTLDDFYDRLGSTSPEIEPGRKVGIRKWDGDPLDRALKNSLTNKGFQEPRVLFKTHFFIGSLSPEVRTKQIQDFFMGAGFRKDDFEVQVFRPPEDAIRRLMAGARVSFTFKMTLDELVRRIGTATPKIETDSDVYANIEVWKPEDRNAEDSAYGTECEKSLQIDSSATDYSSLIGSLTSIIQQQTQIIQQQQQVIHSLSGK